MEGILIDGSRIHYIEGGTHYTIDIPPLSSRDGPPIDHHNLRPTSSIPHLYKATGMLSHEHTNPFLPYGARQDPRRMVCQIGSPPSIITIITPTSPSTRSPKIVQHPCPHPIRGFFRLHTGLLITKVFEPVQHLWPLLRESYLFSTGDTTKTWPVPSDVILGRPCPMTGNFIIATQPTSHIVSLQCFDWRFS